MYEKRNNTPWRTSSLLEPALLARLLNIPCRFEKIF